MIIARIIYFSIIFFFLMASLFIVYHLVRYSYNRKMMILMLLIFSSVTGVLILLNITLFLSLDLSEIVSPLNL